jgi:hypothetical protein
MLLPLTVVLTNFTNVNDPLYLTTAACIYMPGASIETWKKIAQKVCEKQWQDILIVKDLLNMNIKIFVAKICKFRRNVQFYRTFGSYC